MSWRTRFLFGVDKYDLTRVLQQFSNVTVYRLKLFNSLYKKLGNKKILVIDYDNFLYQFENELERICNFLKLERVFNKIDVERFDLHKSKR